MKHLKFQAYVALHVFIKMEESLKIKCFLIYCAAAICYGCGLIPFPPMKQELTRMVSSVGVPLTVFFFYIK
jgi:hypothetical protein